MLGNDDERRASVRDGGHRRRPGRTLGRLPPGPARPAVRHPRRERAGRRRLAQSAGTRCACSRPPASTAWPGCVPAPALVVPDQGRDGRLPRGLRGALRLPVRNGVRVDAAHAGQATGSSSTAGERRFEAEHVVVAMAPTGRRASRRSPPSSTRASCSCTRASTATRPSCATAACWSSAPATRAPRSRSSSRARTRPGCRAGTCGEIPVRHGSRAGAARAPGASGSSSTAC